jgi:DNA invertase Pin-like site-specific DNA recombinase
MQRDRIAAWCRGNDYDLSAVFVETMSGGRMDNRPELNRAVGLACKLRAILVVYSLSRFSRSVRDTLAMSEQLDRAGANLASLSEQLDSSSAVGRMVFKMLSTLAEFERDQTAERTRNALGHMRRGNRRISGKIPFGHSLASDGATLVPKGGEQKTITRILAFRAGGMSLRAIASRLNARKVMTSTGKTWFPATVKCVLDRQHKLAT